MVRITVRQLKLLEQRFAALGRAHAVKLASVRPQTMTAPEKAPRQSDAAAASELRKTGGAS